MFFSIRNPFQLSFEVGKLSFYDLYLSLYRSFSNHIETIFVVWISSYGTFIIHETGSAENIIIHDGASAYNFCTRIGSYSQQFISIRKRKIVSFHYCCSLLQEMLRRQQWIEYFSQTDKSLKFSEKLTS